MYLTFFSFSGQHIPANDIPSVSLPFSFLWHERFIVRIVFCLEPFFKLQGNESIVSSSVEIQEIHFLTVFEKSAFIKEQKLQIFILVIGIYGSTLFSFPTAY